MRTTRIFAAIALVTLSGCATLQQVLALRNVDFSVDRLGYVRLAGVELGRFSSFGELGLADTGRLLQAFAAREVPLEMIVYLEATNPPDNSVDARLVTMDWTLLIQNRETISGTFAEETLLPPGEPTDVPIAVNLNLIDFFEGSAQDLVELALSFAGAGGSPKEITLRATPTVETAIGPIRYPQPITIVSREIGQ